jgi:uncharacterized RDD family membrane protein YckC
MKKTILSILFALTCAVLFAQDSSVVIDDGGDTSGLPGWLEAAIAFVIAVVPTTAWARAKYRLGKFVALVKVLNDSLADNTVDNSEIAKIRVGLKDLVAKEES